jgi:hypothetical protein
MVTVPVELLPPATLLGLKLIEVTLIPGVTVTESWTVLFPMVAVNVTTVLLRTNKLSAAAWKVAVVSPAGIVMLPGTCGNTEPLSELRPTTEPPAGAASLKVTVPVELPPFEMVVGLNVSDETVGPHPSPVLGVSSKSVPKPFAPPWFVVPQRLPLLSNTRASGFAPFAPLNVTRSLNTPAVEYTQTTPSPNVPP